MGIRENISRRAVLSTGVAALTAGTASINETYASPKAPGETRVLYFGGDYVHNGVAQERYIRQTFASSGWHLIFAQASRPIPCLGTTHADHFYGDVPVERITDCLTANASGQGTMPPEMPSATRLIRGTPAWGMACVCVTPSCVCVCVPWSC